MLDKFEQQNRYYRKLRKRSKELEEIKKKLPYRDLREPIHSGWFLELNLTDKALKAKGGEQLQEALILSRREFITYESKKISKIRDNKSLAEVRKLFTSTTFFKKFYKGPGLIKFTEKDFKDKVPERLRKWFVEVKKYDHNGAYTIGRGFLSRTYNLYYTLNVTDNDLVCKVRKRMLTKIKDINPDIESELKWIDTKLEPYYRQSDHSYGKSWRSGRESIQNFRKHFRANVNIFMKGEIDILSYKKLGRNVFLKKLK